MTARAAFLSLLLLTLPAGARAGPPGGGFSLPAACQPGRDCWIMNYADADPGPAARDFACGPRTYNGHKGTDFAIRDLAAMRAGVAVTAVADGTVLRARDGLPDAGAQGDASDRAACGNGVVVDHGGGWTSQYCHLRRGSVAAKPGQRVERGARLGLIGLSGRTEFPHVHLSLRQNGRDVDPYTGRPVGAGCGMPGAPLWRDPMAARYDAGGLYAAGFAAGRVAARRIKANAASPSRLPVTSPALVLWGAALGVRKGDVLRLIVTGPGGKIIDHRTRLTRDRAWQYAFAGARPPAGGWPAGAYHGEVRHLRDGRQVGARRAVVELR